VYFNFTSCGPSFINHQEKRLNSKRRFKMTKFTSRYYIVAIILSVFFIYSFALAQDDNLGNNVEQNDVPAGSLNANSARGLCTAAINSDGTVAGGQFVNKNPAETRRISPGTYEVDFRNPCNNITAARGWARYVQPDTLQIGFLPPRICTTADRAGDASSVYIECYDTNGVLTDTSFFLTITR
jgi:hypothetical protein